MSNLNKQDNNISSSNRCDDCKNVQKDVTELRNFVAHWFDVFVRRFNNQDEKLAQIVQSLAATGSEPVVNNNNQDAITQSDARVAMEDNQVQNKDNVFRAVEVDEELEDIKPDVNILRQNLLKEETKSPESSKFDNFNVSSSDKSKTKNKLNELSPSDETSTSTKPVIAGNFSTTANECNNVKQKQVILLGEHHQCDTKKLTIIKGPGTAPVISYLNPESNSFDATHPSATVDIGNVHQLQTTSLGSLYRRPLSDAAKSRLRRWRKKPVKPNPPITTGSSSFPYSTFREPSEEAKRRLTNIGERSSGKTTLSITTPMLSAELKRRLVSDAIKAMKRKNSNTLSTNPNLSSSTGKSTKRKYGKSRSSVSSDDEPLSASVVSNKDKDMKNTTASVKLQETTYKYVPNDYVSVKTRRCPVCCKKFISFFKLMEHKQTHHSIKTEGQLSLDEDTNQPKTADEGDKPTVAFKCKYCPKTFSDENQLYKHKMDHFRYNNNKFKCNSCKQTYARFRCLIRHAKCVHKCFL